MTPSFAPVSCARAADVSPPLINVVGNRRSVVSFMCFRHLKTRDVLEKQTLPPLFSSLMLTHVRRFATGYVVKNGNL